jgi:N-formylglutamate deformylase
MESASIHLPEHDPAPLLYNSPHSGRLYPEDFHTRLTDAVLRRGEDAYVDELILPAVTCGVAVMTATCPRCYIDVNREPDDIDPAVLAEPWPLPLRPSDTSARGAGLVRRLLEPGVEIHARRLTVEDVCRRIESVYEPYHRRLGVLVNQVRRIRGFVWMVDWHSMASAGAGPNPVGDHAPHPDIVVSDLDGTSASPDFTARVVDAFQGFGYRVAVNHPDKGGTILRRYANPRRGVHVLRITINRRLYLNEDTVERSPGFAALQADVLALSQMLVAAVRTIPPRNVA